jgi:hypothetical protein
MRQAMKLEMISKHLCGVSTARSFNYLAEILAKGERK